MKTFKQPLRQTIRSDRAAHSFDWTHRRLACCLGGFTGCESTDGGGSVSGSVYYGVGFMTRGITADTMTMRTSSSRHRIGRIGLIRPHAGTTDCPPRQHATADADAVHSIHAATDAASAVAGR